MLGCNTGKAFDSVWHDMLISKLFDYNLPLYLTKTIQNYLIDKIFFVTIDSTNSLTFNIPAEVPQGSILSPSLFNIYTSDLPELPSGVHIGLYADDTGIWVSGRQTSTLTRKITVYFRQLLQTKPYQN